MKIAAREAAINELHTSQFNNAMTLFGFKTGGFGIENNLTQFFLSPQMLLYEMVYAPAIDNAPVIDIEL